MRMLSLIAITLLLVSCSGKETTTTDAAEGKAEMEKKVTETKKKGAEAAGDTTTAGTISDAVVCKAGKDERQIGKREREGGGCEVVYTKHGDTSVIADARNDVSYCDNVVDKIKTNLTNAGFTCN